MSKCATRVAARSCNSPSAAAHTVTAIGPCTTPSPSAATRSKPTPTPAAATARASKCATTSTIRRGSTCHGSSGEGHGCGRMTPRISQLAVTQSPARDKEWRMEPQAKLFERYRTHGDLAALGEVFDQLAPRLLPVALHLCGNPADAEDALQQTFLLAMRRATAFDPSRRLEPWLAGLLTNVAHNVQRSAGRRRTEPLPDLVSGDEGPVASAERGELVAHLRTHVESLPQEQRQVLLLQLQHGLAPAEIAEVLEVPPGTVRMRLHRGLQALRKLLPAGLAAWLFGALPARGLAAVRQSVMEAAGKEAVVVGAGASAAAAVAGVLAMKKVIALMVAGLLVGILLWVASGPAASPVLRSLADGATRPVAAALADRAGAPSGSDSPPVNRIAVTDPPGSLRVRASFLMQTRAGPPPAVGLAINHCPADCALEVWPGDRASPTFGTSSFARTDAGGEVVFAGLAPGIWQVRSVAGMRNPRPAVVASARETSVSVGLIGDGVVRGRVVDVDGRPVTGADVLLFTQAGDESLLMSNRGDRSRAPDLHLRRAVASDAEGRFAIPFAEGEFIVAAAKAGHAPSFAQLTRWLGVAELTLTLGREIGSVEGTVLDRLGAAVPHALVEVRERRPEVHRTADGTLLLRPLPQFARTDERGRFRVDRLSPGRYRLLAVASSHMPGYSELEVGADGHASVDLRLDA